MGRGDPKGGTRRPGRKNGTSHPGRDVLVRDGSPGAGLAGHVLLPHKPIHRLNLLVLLFYNIKYFKAQKFAFWPVDYKSLPKERNCILRFGAKIPGITPIVIWYSQLLSNTVQNQSVRSEFYLRQPRLPLVTSGGLVAIGTDRYHAWNFRLWNCMCVCLFFHSYSYIVRNINCSE